MASVGGHVAKSSKTQGHPILATKRLRQFEARDVEGLHACFGDVKAMRYWNFPPCETEAESARWVKIMEKNTSPYQFLAWAVADKRSDKCIGMVNYHHREARNAKLEIGYILASAQQDGLMKEALEALLASASRSWPCTASKR